MQYLLFGTGEYYQRYKKWFSKDEVVALLDNSRDKQGTYIDGIQVFSPQEGVGRDFDVVVILSFYIKEMKLQLIELGVEESKIYHFFDLRKLLGSKAQRRPLQCYGSAENIMNMSASDRKKILLLSHDLTLGGPALALYNAAEVLKKNGYEVVVGSMLDGSLRALITDHGIPVVVDENLQIETMNEAGWTKCFDLVLCNTFAYYVFLSERDTDSPLIWWLHDSSFFYGGVDKALIGSINTEHISIVSVGEVPRRAIQEFNPALKIENLLYGVQDVCQEPHGVTLKGKIKFLTIGYIENRKGQDILLAAIKRLPDEIVENCEFWLVGNDTSLLADQIKEEIKSIPQVTVTGIVDRQQIESFLNESDVLICPSREDPLPTVAAEAMMHSVPCLMSDAVGTAAYISPQKDGLLFQNENVEQLKEQIIWCVSNRDRIRNMGKNARKVFEEYFSMEVFEYNFMLLVDRIVKNGRK